MSNPLYCQPTNGDHCHSHGSTADALIIMDHLILRVRQKYFIPKAFHWDVPVLFSSNSRLNIMILIIVLLTQRI